MKKKIIPFLVTFISLGILKAQTITNQKILKSFSDHFKVEEELNYAKAVTMAKEKKWGLHIQLRGGGKAILSGVDEFGFPKYIKSYNNIISATTSRTNQLWPGGKSGLGLTGSSTAMRNKLGIWEFDGAPLANHVEFGGRITQKDVPQGSSGNDHATHVAGTMIASGINPIAKGMSFGAVNLLAYDHASDLSEMTTEAADGILLSNHSYGLVAGWNFNSSENRWEFWGRPDEQEDYRFGYYSQDAQRIDSIAYNAPNYLIISSAGNDRDNNGPEVGKPFFRLNASGNMVSAGNRSADISSNDGFDIISGYGVAKNNLTVGAVYGIPTGYKKSTDVTISNFSSWGPTDDGRIKPDLVASGVNITSTSTNGSNSYSTKSGTSMASPNITGSLFLLQEYYTKLRPGNFMRSSTLKGLAIHTAEEAGIDPGPDYSFGWGLLNVQKAANVLTNAVASNNAPLSSDLLFENSINQGEIFTKQVVASGKMPLSATISWTDPVGKVNNNDATNLNDETKKLVHDLDIRITRNLQEYKPWTLNPASPTAPAKKGDNITDNIERVEIDSTIPGETYTITVSHKGTLERGSQAYALIISGVGGTNYCASTSNGGGARIDSISFANIQKQQTLGCKTYTNNTHLIAAVQAKQVVPINIQVNTCDASTNNRMLKVFIDFNNDGDFNDAPELATTSGILPSISTLYSSNITIPDEVIIGTTTRMRVIVQETSVASDINACGSYGKGETQDYLIKIANPSNDVAITNIIAPQTGSCANPAQFITVTISNNGSLPQINIPISVSIANGNVVIATINEIYKGSIAAQASVNHTFQTPFPSAPNTTYTITATTALPTDQQALNNQELSTISTAINPSLPVGEGTACESSAILRIPSPGNSNYFWYISNTSNSPIASGSNITANPIPLDKTFFVAKEARSSVGPATKLSFPNGGYNSFGGNYMKFSHDVPITIETVKLYIGNSGKIRFTLGDNLTAGSTAGSYTYRPISAITLDVLATTPTPTEGALSGNNPSDTGAVHALNFAVPGSGDKIIITECLDGATIFRNNGITGTSTYPTGTSGLMSYTGNSVSLAPQAGQNENQFWYFLYDTRVNSGCVSARVPVVVSTNPPLTIAQLGDSLIGSISNGIFQWTFNDTGIVTGGAMKSIKPTKTGNYKLSATDVLGCTRTSANFSFIVGSNPSNPIDPSQNIKLFVSPNPNNGYFQLSFEVPDKTDMSIELLSITGQRVYYKTYTNFSGNFIQTVRIPNLGNGIYFLKILLGEKIYTHRILVQ